MEPNDEALRGDHGRWWWGGGVTAEQLAAAVAPKANSSDVSMQLALKAPLASPTFSGTTTAADLTVLGDIRMVDSASSFVCKKLEAPPSSNLQVAGDVVTMGLVNMLGGALVGDCQLAGTVTGLSKNSVGLSNVNDTSDQNKPVSVLTQAALDGKASLAQLSTKQKALLVNVPSARARLFLRTRTS